MRATAPLFPVLLANGENDLQRATCLTGAISPNGTTRGPNRSYLFALVAGDLVANRDHFTTMSGKSVDLAIYVRDGDVDPHAPRHGGALKASMAWDERVYGREYDLSVFNIVAVADFNAGAMENKGLNIFNTRYILADSDTATDLDFDGVQGVVAHEYFHNWSGNRVTCRDWFQLSLKEGFTVYRDQMLSRPTWVQRRSQADRGCADAARSPVPGRQRPARAPDPARQLSGNLEFLYVYRL